MLRLADNLDKATLADASKAVAAAAPHVDTANAEGLATVQAALTGKNTDTAAHDWLQHIIPKVIR